MINVVVRDDGCCSGARCSWFERAATRWLKTLSRVYMLLCSLEFRPTAATVLDWACGRAQSIHLDLARSGSGVATPERFGLASVDGIV